MNIREYNKYAWDRLVEAKNQWTIPVSTEDIARARRGDWDLILTPSKKIPKHWFPQIPGAEILCLASGGGQQGPILAAAGGQVTVFDNSPNQLAQDRLVAQREGLSIKTVEGDMADLSCFADESFDLILHPCSNCFVPNVKPVWRECFRVLRRGGILIAGFSNPVTYLFDSKLEKDGIMQARFSIPYSDATSLSQEERKELFGDDPIEFGHSLEDQIGGQIAAGFVITGFYEDDWGGSRLLDKFINGFIRTRAVKQ